VSGERERIATFGKAWSVEEVLRVPRQLEVSA
jgi:hypothetical protein